MKHHRPRTSARLRRMLPPRWRRVHRPSSRPEDQGRQEFLRAAGSGSLWRLRVAWRGVAGAATSRVLNAATKNAASAGSASCLRFLLRRGGRVDGSCFAYAYPSAENGLDPWMCLAAVQNRSPACLRYAVDHGYECDPMETFLEAALAGSLACMRFLAARFGPALRDWYGAFDVSYVLECAVIGGSVACLRFALHYYNVVADSDRLQEWLQHCHRKGREALGRFVLGLLEAM